MGFFLIALFTYMGIEAETFRIPIIIMFEGFLILIIFGNAILLSKGSYWGKKLLWLSLPPIVILFLPAGILFGIYVAHKLDKQDAKEYFAHRLVID